MGLLDTLLGRTKPVKANLDGLFALPAAAVTLQAATGLVSSGQAGVCFKAPAGQAFAQMEADVERLINTDDPLGGPDPADSQSRALRHQTDSFGYHWIVVEAAGLDDLVTAVHMVHSSLEDAGWSQQLLCSVFGFAMGSEPGADPEALGPGTGGRHLYLIYLAKRGTFYPFCPAGGENRDAETELRVRGVLGEDLPVETDTSRWFPLWDLPVA